MNNLIYSYDFMHEVTALIPEHVEKNGRIFYPEDIIAMLDRANELFDPVEPVVDQNEHTSSIAHSDVHYSEEPPKDDDIASTIRKKEVSEASDQKEEPVVQQASDAEDVAEHIKADGDYARVCTRCGKIFTADSPKRKLCPECRKESQKKANRKYAEKHKDRNKKAKNTEKNAERYADSVAREVDNIESVARDIIALGDD